VDPFEARLSASALGTERVKSRSGRAKRPAGGGCYRFPPFFVFFAAFRVPFFAPAFFVFFGIGLPPFAVASRARSLDRECTIRKAIRTVKESTASKNM